MLKILKLTLSQNFYLQNFLAANSQCWWNTPLTAATRSLKYAGHVAPGLLLVTAEPCALEIMRGAYARSVLKPPATYQISFVGKPQNLKLFVCFFFFLIFLQFFFYSLVRVTFRKYAHIKIFMHLRAFNELSTCKTIFNFKFLTSQDIMQNIIAKFLRAFQIL